MLTATISDFRKDIKKYLDRVTKNFETLIINRGKDNGVVIMSLDEYNSLSATSHELSSKTNESRLLFCAMHDPSFRFSYLGAEIE